MTEPIHDTHTSTTGGARRAMAPATGRLALSDDRLLDELRRNARVSTRRIRADFVEVHTPTRVLGYVKGQRKSFVALRGDDPAWAEEIGRYPSESLAVEALRMRRA
ncbi:MULTISPECIES: hypothetical protein [unclassified Curtobacterium]|uniref:hypothetical protein n=1 Tax=unclassified Curtobacterium TaxID=257496 RepID=UPI000DA7F447|nr:MULTISPECIES: hypothetical protein [unclassified Curtobacterium]PZF56822.1 hypothetical protein DEI81_15770 [Curtobacterium sp. MCBD17_013]WIB63272.1 hypothetical protein DEI94_14150 [Curtobacterium sp. MCBD17_040]